MIPYLLFYKIAQLFVVMFLGFALVKTKLLKGKESKVLSKIALYLLMPSVLINSFDIELDSNIKKCLSLAFIAAIVIHIMLLLIDALYNKIFKPTGAERASVIYSNAANLIIPIVGFVLGEEWVIYSCAFVAVQITLIWTQGVSLFEKGQKTNYKKIIFNPCILAIFVGLLLMILGVRLPAFIKEITSSMGSMVGNVGMLISGMLMADVSFKKIFMQKRIYTAVLLRMVICPVCALFVLKLMAIIVPLADASKLLLVTYLAAITPSASMVTQLSQVYNSGEEDAVAINVISTLICIITMPIFVTFY